MDLCSSVASTGGLGFPGGSLGWVRSRLVLVVYGRPLRPYLILICLEQHIPLPLDVLLGP